MTLIVKEYVLFDPADVSFFGSDAVVPGRGLSRGLHREVWARSLGEKFGHIDLACEAA